MSHKDLMRIENRVAVLKEYSELWQQFFTFFSDSLAERQITAQEEQEFSQIVSILALNQFKMAELTKDVFKDGPKVLDILKDSVSLVHLKSLPENSFNKLQVDWHTLFISMNKGLGKLLSQLPPKKLAEMQKAAASQAPPSPGQ